MSMPIADYSLKSKAKREESFNKKLASFWNKYGDVISKLPFIPGTGILDWFVTRKVLGYPSREGVDKILQTHKKILIKRFNESVEKGVPNLYYKKAIDNVNKVIEVNKNAPNARLASIRLLESKFKNVGAPSFNSFNKSEARKALRVLYKLERERTRQQRSKVFTGFNLKKAA
jgi:hypothetical protein